MSDHTNEAANGNPLAGILRESQGQMGGAFGGESQDDPVALQIFSNSIHARNRRDTINMKLNRRKFMLWTIFVILLVLWLIGLIGGYMFGGFIHILIVLAVIVLIINLVSGRRGV